MELNRGPGLVSLCAIAWNVKATNCGIGVRYHPCRFFQKALLFMWMQHQKTVPCVLSHCAHENACLLARAKLLFCWWTPGRACFLDQLLSLKRGPRMDSGGVRVVVPASARELGPFRRLEAAPVAVPRICVFFWHAVVFARARAGSGINS